MDRLLELTITLLSPDERQRLAHLDHQLDNGQLPRKSQILTRNQPSYFPTAVIYLVCCRAPFRWSPFELCRRFWACWRCLPEDAKCGRASPEAHQLVSLTLTLVNNSYESVYELLHASSPAAAIVNPENGDIISHSALTRLVSSFALPPSTVAKPVVAISLPNGPLLAAVLVATTTFYTAAPLQHGVGVGPEQFKRDVLQSGSNFVLASTADVERLRLRDPWLAEAQIQVLLIEIAKGDFVIRSLSFERLKHKSWAQPKPNRAGDIAILLFTSGTSGAKKLVPLHIESLVTGVAMVQSSWALTPASRCLNQMPLNHVGGIVRNLFAPIMSGGSVICCPGFDANAFWDAVDDYSPTWYYASPTMHQCILEAAADRPESRLRSKITLICNAAGGLLPSLACQLRDTFSRPGMDCVVLPSYGMTECMPISTPLMSYRLERTGTSGVSVGPEIAVLDAQDNRMAAGNVGRIAVRGAPIFAGYLKEGILDRSCFTKDAWFDTGDMGHLDKDGYLYITGRSKEVINRGGELISPFEIEDAVLAAAKDEASPIYGRISKALAFSVPHDVLQEVVGLVVVTPMDCKRPCLKTIQEATKSALASVKVPVLLAFMSDDLPTNNNKVLRIRLAERLGITSISDTTPQDRRYYEAICPPPNTPLGTNIRSRRLLYSPEDLDSACRSLLPPAIDFHIDSSTSHLHPVLRLAPVTHDAPVSMWHAGANEELRQKLLANLDAYCVPSRIDFAPKPFIRDGSGKIVNLPAPETRAPKRTWSVDGQAQQKIIAAFAEILDLQPGILDGQSNFFELGGDSMKAGRLLSALRKSFVTRITIDVLFNNSTISALTSILDTAPVENVRHSLPAAGLVKSLPGCARTRSSTNFLLLLLQLLPIGVLAPMRRALTWTLFIYCLTYSASLPTQATLPGRFINLVMSLLIGKAVTEICIPPIAVILKWLIIGRYQEGLYPMWGLYHTRWWLVQKILSVGGLGIYEYSAITRNLYYRCLGAHIGKNVVIDKDAKLGEYDLLYIGDNVVLDACTVRPFAVERNTSMYLGRIRIGSNASIGQASFVAAGTVVPVDACIGANSSSWELDDADEANRELSPSKAPKPHWALELFVGIPLTIAAYFIGAIPWMGGLMPLVITDPGHNHDDPFREVVLWFSSPQRVVFHYVALACRAAIGPVFFFFAVLAIKKMLDACCGGSIQPGPARARSQMDRFRMSLMQKLMPDSQFHRLTTLFGTHYSPTSWFARRLGAKVGKNVYWPGKGPLIQDFDMIDIGDNVVFGSRSSIVTSDGFGTKPVTIGNNAMVADRVILRPGTTLGSRTVMGSGALSQRSKHYPSDSTWVGSKKNDAVCLVAEASPSGSSTPRHDRYRSSMESAGHKNEKTVTVAEAEYDSRTSSMTELKVYDDEYQTVPIHGHPSSSPFGRAFYEGLASYRVWGQTTIALYSTFLTIFAAVFWNIHSIGAIQVVAWMYRQKEYTQGFLRDRETRPLFIYAFFTALIAGIMAVQIVLALSIVIASKWILMGRRKQGNYDWDKSPYCQRWQLFLKIESLRQKCYGGHGILGLLTGTHWIVLYFKALGANIGKDCALFASGTPSLYFTEPDLLTLGDRVSVDDASLVCHINTRGKFDLNPLYVGDRSVLRSGSRLLSGARMEDDSCLLEHTLVMAGDVVDAETAIQGWPGDEFKGNRLPTMRVAYHWETA